MATLLSQAPRAPLSCRAPLLRRRRSAAHVGKGVVTVSSSESQNNGVNGSSGGGGDSGGDGHTRGLVVVQKLGQKLVQRVRDEPLAAACVVVGLAGFFPAYSRLVEGPPFTEP